MDPRLFDTLWEVYRTAGATQPIQIYSAYRSPETNAMLRRRSRAVAEHSQHMLGKAMDTTIPGFPMHLIREVGMRLQHGGVGWYPSANFVHLDVGGVRSWPRMSYDQLASLFPDGKTVHIASDGRTLPGYEAARQEIAARGAEPPPSQESGGFFAWLFGGWGNTAGAAKEDEEDRSATVAVARAAPAPAPVAAAPAPPPPETVLAYAPQPEPAQPAPVRRSRRRLPTRSAPSPRRPPAGRWRASRATPASRCLWAARHRPCRCRRGARPPSALTAEPDIPLPPLRPTELARLESRPVRHRPSRRDGRAAQRPRRDRQPHHQDGLRRTCAAPLAPSRSHLAGHPHAGPGSGLRAAGGRGSRRAAGVAPRRRLRTRPLGLRAALRASRSEASTTPSSPSTVSPAPRLLNAARLTGLRRAARAHRRWGGALRHRSARATNGDRHFR